MRRNAWLWRTAREKCYVACRMLRKCGGAWPDLDPVQKHCALQIEKGCRKRNAAVIVRLFSVFTRSEAVYDMHFVPPRTVLLHQGSRKGRRLHPTGRSVSGT